MPECLLHCRAAAAAGGATAAGQPGGDARIPHRITLGCFLLECEPQKCASRIAGRLLRLAALRRQASLAAMPAFRAIFAQIAASCTTVASAVRDFQDLEKVSLLPPFESFLFECVLRRVWSALMHNSTSPTYVEDPPASSKTTRQPGFETIE